MTVLERAWYKPRSWVLILLPLSWLFKGIASLRKSFLQKRYQGKAFAVPVVVVGNISVGGTGKTPLLIALVKSLQVAGYRPGIVSRGYGGSASSIPRKVTAQSASQEMGDEPVLIAREVGCPVVVASDRAAAVEFIIREFEIDIVLSDDGLQHYRMHRDFEIAVLDARRGLGNKQCLPAGPLREPPARLAEVDCVVLNGAADGQVFDLPPALARLIKMQLKPTYFRHLRSGKRVASDAWPGSRNVHALAGIGNPERFSASLSALALEPLLHRLPDHHQFQASDLAFEDGLDIVITAKDAVKCEAFAPDNVWVLEVEADISAQLVDLLKKLLPSTTASTTG